MTGLLCSSQTFSLRSCSWLLLSSPNPCSITVPASFCIGTDRHTCMTIGFENIVHRGELVLHGSRIYHQRLYRKTKSSMRWYEEKMAASLCSWKVASSRKGSMSGARGVVAWCVKSPRLISIESSPLLLRVNLFFMALMTPGSREIISRALLEYETGPRPSRVEVMTPLL